MNGCVDFSAAAPADVENKRSRAAVTFRLCDVADGKCRRAIIVDDGAGALTVAQRRVGGIVAQVYEEGLVGFVGRVAVDLDGDLLTGLTRQESDGAAVDCVIAWLDRRIVLTSVVN